MSLKTLTGDFTNEHTLNREGVMPDKFYSLIGKMALIHAGIEHDIKGIISEDWKVSSDKVEGLHGFRLRKIFLKEMRSSGVPEKYYGEYSLLIDKYWIASERRNGLIKASYGLMRDSGEVFKYGPKSACGEYDPNIPIHLWLEKGGELVCLKEIEQLISELAQIREDIFQLSRRIFIESLINSNPS